MAQFNSYPQKATPIAADTVLIYDSAGAVLKQVPIKNLFENYAGTSLGGSTQTVKSAIDALNSKFLKSAGNIPPNSSVTFNIEKNSRMVLVITCAHNNALCQYIVNSSSVSAVYRNKLGTAELITDSVTTGELTLSNATSGTATVWAYVMAGSITIKTS